MPVPTALPNYKIGLLGYGEAGRAIAASLADGFEVGLCAYDHAYLSAEDRRSAPIELVDCPEALARQAEVIISVVTADQSYDAARSLLPYLSSHHLFCDANSVSPGTKKNTAGLFSARHVEYIDMAIMAPIYPAQHRTKLLLSGAGRDRLAPMLEALDFQYDWQGETVGDACEVKMLRSILIKGVESLVTECVTAAQMRGLDSDILASAGKTLGIDDMAGLADYVMERVAVHGARRSAEMFEVAKTLSELGMPNDMATATAHSQARIATFDLSRQFENKVPQDRAKLATAIRAALSDE